MSPSQSVARPSRPRRLFLLIALVLGAVVGVEIGLRVYAKLSLRERGLGFDPLLGWRPLPDVRKVGAFWSADEPARTNSHGWRDAEHSRRKPAGVFRVVALGDSFTFGVAVDYGERYTERLEELATDVEVLNLGVNAYGPDQELLLLEREGLAYEPDLVVVTIFPANDLDDMRHEVHFDWPRPYFLLHGEELELVPPVRTLEVAIRTRSYLGEALFSLAERKGSGSRIAPAWRDADTLPLFTAVLKRMAATCETAGVPLCAILVRLRRSLQGAPLAAEDEVAERIRTLGVPLIDTRDVFAASRQETGALFAPDGHWSPAGHDLVARALLEHIRTAGSAPSKSD